MLQIKKIETNNNWIRKGQIIEIIKIKQFID